MGDAVALLRAAREHRPDVAIIDVQMPPDLTDDGVRAALAIRAEFPGTGVLVGSHFRGHAATSNVHRGPTVLQPVRRQPTTRE